jgi:HK97 family phage major capsid protein
MEIETDATFETKAGIPADAAVTHAELMRAFDEFKEANDQKLTEKRSVDVLLEEKIERLDSVIAAQTQRLEAIELKQARPAIGSEPRTTEPANQPAIEHKAAFDAYVRGGDSANLRALEQKALSGSSNPDGGFLVPPEIETIIGERLFNISPIRSLASIRTISSTTNEDILPAFYSDNYFSLMPGESKTVTVEFNPKYLKGGRPVFKLSGWNTKAETIDRTENRK